VDGRRGTRRLTYVKSERDVCVTSYLYTKYVRTVEAAGGLPAYDGWEDLVLEVCERVSNIIVGLLERPLVNELLGCEVIGDIDMETTEIRSG
jgi:hypothetical protein